MNPDVAKGWYVQLTSQLTRSEVNDLGGVGTG